MAHVWVVERNYGRQLGYADLWLAYRSDARWSRADARKFASNLRACQPWALRVRKYVRAA